MSWKSGGGNNGVGKATTGGIAGIPAGSRKMVQSLKEIVNCPESEIYAMLKECNMDPNEAVNRLLSQDPFHEVKSKREKKKENKETTDYRPRGAGSASNRGSRAGVDRYVGRGGGTQFSTNDSGTSYGKPGYKKENGVHSYAGSSSSASASGISGNTTNWQLPSHSETVATERKMMSGSIGDGVSSSLQPPSGVQSSWFGAPGQKSMADIVKMGRPQNKASAATNPPHNNTKNHHFTAPSSQGYASKESEADYELEVSASHVNDEWPLIENRPAANLFPLDTPDDDPYVDPSNTTLDGTSQHLNEVQEVEDGPVEDLDANEVRSASASSRNIQEDISGDSPIFDNNLNNMESYQNQEHLFEHNEADDEASSVATNLNQLSIQNDDRETTGREDIPGVIIPNHLQVHTPDCSHLSFGSFGAGIGSAYSGSFASRTYNDKLEESSEAVDSSSIAHSDARNPEYYGEEHLISTSDGGNVHRGNASAGNYESTSDSQTEVLKQETEAAQGNQYAYPSSAPGYMYENSQQLNSFASSQPNSQIQNLAQFSSVMQAYTNSLPNNLLASNVHAVREPDLQYSPFPVTQSMPTKYTNSAASISGPTISMQEALRVSDNSTSEPTQQTSSSATVATGPVLQQHLAMHPYSQPTLPLGHFANMIGYPFLPQSYTYMPSAFQQAFSGNSTYHQSLAAVLPQYKNSASVSSLPQSAAVASGYGFGSSSSIPGGNYPLNQPTAPAGSTIGYDDALSSQYKDNNHLMSLQQNDNSAMWVHGPGSRTMSAVPANTYYGLQGQNQQPGAFRQAQQPSQHFGQLGYPNFYHSQAGVSLDHQQQNPRDGGGSLSGSQQGQQPAKQQTQQQLWQNSY